MCRIVRRHLGSRNEEPSLEPEDVDQGDDEASEHTRDRTLTIDPLGEDSHHDRREERRRREAERECDDLGSESDRKSVV